jgi:hypothetical protein
MAVPPVPRAPDFQLFAISLPKFGMNFDKISQNKIT